MEPPDDGRRGVYGQHRHAVALAYEVQAQHFNEGGLAHARHAADAQPKRLARAGQQGHQQFIALGAVVGAGGFEQRDGFGNGAALHGRVTLQKRLFQLWCSELVHRMSKLRPSGSLYREKSRTSMVISRIVFVSCANQTSEASAKSISMRGGAV